MPFHIWLWNGGCNSQNGGGLAPTATKKKLRFEKLNRKAKFLLVFFHGSFIFTRKKMDDVGGGDDNQPIRPQKFQLKNILMKTHMQYLEQLIAPIDQ